LIVNDQSPSTLVRTSVLCIGLLGCLAGAASAGEPLATDTPASIAAPGNAAVSPSDPPVLVTVLLDGAQSTFPTTAHTVGELLGERGIRVASGDYVSPDAAAPLADGTLIVIRNARPIELRIGSTKRRVRSHGPKVRDVLREQRVTVGRYDRVSPPLDSHVAPNETIAVQRVSRWTAREHKSIEPAVVQRSDAKLALGKIETLSRGSAGERETIVRYTKFDDGAASRTILASRIVREPRPRIIVRGIATYQSLARVATQGFESAVHMAGSALHMIATAYTGACYGCTGMTASGVRAGFGIIAVDPSVIPLGTHLFIPGYGRAVAGDTGGAIVGHRVDLGMNTVTAALHFGRRPVTVYVLR
jgi:uncharacterized protein YabE (DUF348 family)